MPTITTFDPLWALGLPKTKSWYKDCQYHAFSGAFSGLNLGKGDDAEESNGLPVAAVKVHLVHVFKESVRWGVWGSLLRTRSSQDRATNCPPQPDYPDHKVHVDMMTPDKQDINLCSL